MKKIILLSAFLIAGLTNAQTWQNLGSSGVVSQNILQDISQLTIALDNYNVPYVCEIENSTFQPVVKKLNGIAWVNVGTFGNSNTVCSYSSLAINNNNMPYIAYRNSDLNTSINTGYVKKFDGSNWVLVGANGFTNGTEGDYIIKIDNNNVPYVACNGYGNPDKIIIKKFNGTDWIDVSLGLITNASTTAFYFDFEFDNNNNPVVLFDDVEGTDIVLKARKLIGSTWTDIGTGGIVGIGFKPSIAFDSNNVLNVAFVSGNNPDLLVKKFNGTSWVNVGTTIASVNIEKHKLAIGPNNSQVISYKEVQNGYIVNVKKFDGTTWNLITTPTSIGQMDAVQSLAIGNNNIPYVAYNDGTNTKAKFYGASLSTTQNTVLNDLKVYPNPTNDIINIDNNGEISQISITDLLGKIVFQTQENISKIDLSFLKTGVYIAKIETTNGENNIKITKK